jgi:hypothetical protein
MDTMYILGKTKGATAHFPLYFKTILDGIVLHTLTASEAKIFSNPQEAERFAETLPTDYEIVPKKPR